MIPIIQQDEPANFVPWDLSYVYAVQSQEKPQSSSLASLIGDEYIVSTYDLTLPTEPIIEPEVEEIWVSTSFKQPPREGLCSCIDFIKNYFPDLKGKQLFYPTYLWRRFADYNLEKTEPIVGALVILKTDFYEGHIAVITSISENSFEIIEKNWQWCKITTRSFEFGDERIIGFLR